LSKWLSSRSIGGCTGVLAPLDKGSGNNQHTHFHPGSFHKNLSVPSINPLSGVVSQAKKDKNLKNEKKFDGFDGKRAD
jgi:hypothetical protein